MNEKYYNTKNRPLYVQAFANAALDELKNIYPPLDDVYKSLKAEEYGDAGIKFEKAVIGHVCGMIGGDAEAKSMLWFFPQVSINGDVPINGFPGFHCPAESHPEYKKDYFYPDFVMSETSPEKVSRGDGQSILVGDIKISGGSLYSQYVKGDAKQRGQFTAIVKYADRHTYTHIAAFLTLRRGVKWKMDLARKQLEVKGLENGTIAAVVYLFK